MEAFLASRAWIAPRDREAPTGAARRRSAEAGGRLTRCFVWTSTRTTTRMSTLLVSSGFLIIRKRTGQSCQGRLCRGARRVGRRTLTARVLNCWTQWTRTAGTGRPGCASSQTRGGRRCPMSDPTVRRGSFALWCKCCLYSAVDFRVGGSRKRDVSDRRTRSVRTLP